MFNRISPSLLDILHDSRAVSHFLDNITPNNGGLSGFDAIDMWGANKSAAEKRHRR